VDRRAQAKAIVDRLEAVRDRVLDTLEGDAWLEFRILMDRELRALCLEVAKLADFRGAVEIEIPDRILCQCTEAWREHELPKHGKHQWWCWQSR
jgi:hypothetical protein